MKRIFVLVVSTALLVFCDQIRAQNSAPTLSEDEHQAIVATLLFVQSADGMKYDDAAGKLTLTGVAPTVIFFTDRPVRKAGQVLLPGFLQAWSEGSNSFEKDPPNAELSIVKKGEVHSATVELLHPKLNGNALTYDVKVVGGKLPASGETCSLFIDGLFSGGLFGGGARGAALGAIGGAIAGNAGKGAAIGAAVGGIGGALERRREDKEKMKAETTRVLDVPNSNGSYTPVTLHLVPGGWQGPKGEIYPSLPTPEQLKSAYGL